MHRRSPSPHIHTATPADRPHLHPPLARFGEHSSHCARHVGAVTAAVGQTHDQRWTNEHRSLAGFGYKIPPEERGPRVKEQLPEQPLLVVVARFTKSAGSIADVEGLEVFYVEHDLLATTDWLSPQFLFSRPRRARRGGSEAGGGRR